VAAVPEGLPAVITVALALGANRMIKRNALIRKLPAVETLGSVTTICSDKTGTLTRNEMTVTTVMLPGHDTVSVTGIGYDPVGDFRKADSGDILHVAQDDQLARIIKAASLCTDAYLERDEETNQWHIVGDTTEGALIVMARKQGWSRESLEQDMPRVNEIPFTSERKSMTTFHKPTGKFANVLFDNANFVAFIKGAPDNLMEWASEETVPGKHIPLTDERRNTWKEQIEKLAGQGIRVLGVAYRTFDAIPEDLEPENIERNLILLGLIGIVDPPRTEATRAVAVALHAGIRPIMITGDHKLTAQAIAQQLGIIQNGADGVALSGTELDQLTPEQLQETVKTVSVYARVSPEHKLRVVEALQKNDHIVAMTGDGVNDAPALKQANIGVAMGITGTDVSKGAADMVLTDDNFASIVSAVEEGRTIYDNIRKFLRYLMGSNMGEILAMFGAIVIGFKLPLVATQILWVNLVTDGLPAIALGFEPAEPGVMDRPPRPPKESIFARGVGIHVLWAGFWMGMVTLISFIYMLDKYGGEIWDPLDADLTMARSMAFFVLATTQVFHVTAIHAGHASFFKAPVWRNRILMFAIALTIALQVGAIYLPFMNTLLDTEPLELEEFALAFVFAASILPAVEIEKAFWRRREAAQQAETPPLPDSM
jgi:Ca2+-transporting ATPase